MPNNHDEGSHEREYFTKWLEGLEKNIDARWKAHEEVHRMGQRAIDAAFAGSQEKFHDIDNFREQSAKERSEFLSKLEYDSRHRELATRMDTEEKAMNKRIADLELSKSNLDGRFWALGVGLFIAQIALTVLLKFWAK